ncbi:MAG: sugar ABC transporter permease [Clostridia bacterium]|nr:sugar ABC transporter permease [Clostridia bacterium]
MSAHPAARPAPGRWFRKRVLAHWQLLALLVIPAAWYIIFCYVPMFGVQLAFKNYKVRQGILGSPWADPLLRHFTRYFSSYYAWSTIWNTLAINLGCLLIGFPAPIILALVLNEINNLRFRKILQNITYIPYFLSIVVVVSMFKLFTDQRYGVINIFIQALGMKAIPLMESEYYFRPLYVLSNVWQNMGWNAIIYIAALAGVDTALYEAATVDGASRWQKIIHVSIPCILPTSVTMLILRIGQLMTIGFEKALLMQNDLNIGTSEIISTLVYKNGIQKGDYSYATAVGLMNSVVNLVLIVTANTVCRKTLDQSLW